MEWWRFEGWPTAEEWQAWWAFMTVVVAAAAAWFALGQYKASVRSHLASVRSRLEQARPYITVDFVFDSGLIVIEVKNSGLTAAEDIQFTWSKRPVAESNVAQRAIDRALINDGIPFLAPGRSIRFFLAEFNEHTTPRQYRVAITCIGSGTNDRWYSQSALDLDQWAEALVERDPYESIARPLKKIAAEVGKTPLGPTFETRAAEALYAYLEAQPEVKRYRRRREREDAEQERMLEERNRRLHERLRRMSGRGDGGTTTEGSSTVK